MIQSKYKSLLFKIMATGYWSDFYIYPIVIVALITLAIWKLHMSIGLVILLIIAGFIIWGIVEYFTHRYLFHHVPLFKTGHEEHHKRPRSPLGTPTWITLSVYLLIAWGIALIVGYGITTSLLAGFLVGYYSYVSCHHIVHHWRIKPNTFLYRYKKFHDMHHYKQEVNFGVSWLIWDKLFHTYHKSNHSSNKN